MTPESTTMPPVDGRKYPFLTPLGPDTLGAFAGYTVRGLLGTGGMGHVFEADDTALGRTVAVKVLRPELAADAENRARFLREARAAAGLVSDHVVTVHQVGEANGLPYIAMQRLRGVSLHERMNRSPKLTVTECLDIARQVAAGLAAAHAVNMVHRDIKPANLWLEEKTGRVKILDFGLARFARDADLTATGFVVGTPSFMAPEQASGGEIDGRADLFSLGCVLYAMLTGTQPFPGNSAMAVMMALASTVPPSVSSKNPAVPTAVSDYVARLLEKRPGDRPPSAAAVVAALDALKAGRPVPVGLQETSLLPAVAGTAETLRVRPVSVTAPPRGRSRRGFLIAAGGLTAGAVVAGGYALFAPPPGPRGEPIPVGVLHSQSGPMEISEMAVIDATTMAIEEVNAAGGVLGRPLKPVSLDGASDPNTFKAQAEKLVNEHRVPVIFGCWTSASRKSVKPVIERANALLFYPVQYEGLESSPHIVYTGPAPNQQLGPAVAFLTGDLKKKRIYLIGSDYVYPRSANEILMDELKNHPGVTVLGPDYLLLTEKDPAVIARAVAKIVAAKPDAIVNTINGSANVEFFAALRRAKITPAAVPTLSVSITENELVALGRASEGDYLAASYFQSVATPQSREFIRRIQVRYGDTRVVSDMMASAYVGVHLWAMAANRAKTLDADAVRAAVRGLSFDGPGGPVEIDAETLHAVLPSRIGRVKASGQLEIVREDAPIRPEPYPKSRDRNDWASFLSNLQVKWGGWQNPGP